MAEKEEQTIRRILDAKNHFQLLGIDAEPETITVEEVKKAYRRLAAVVHPDKCKHPDAREAFDSLGKANHLLGDEEMLAKLKHSIAQGKRLSTDLDLPDAKRAAPESGWLTSEELLAFTAHQTLEKRTAKRDAKKEEKEQEIDGVVEESFYGGAKECWSSFQQHGPVVKKKSQKDRGAGSFLILSLANPS
eukprot:291830_1